jgi:hypothetical protein
MHRSLLRRSMNLIKRIGDRFSQKLEGRYRVLFRREKESKRTEIFTKTTTTINPGDVPLEQRKKMGYG